MAQIECRVTGIGEIGLICDLWTELNTYHRDRVGVFSEYYDHTTFNTRKEYFEKLATGGLVRLILASDSGEGRIVGDLVSSLSSEHIGVIESVFVTKGYRGMGVGGNLVAMALAWLEGSGSQKYRVSVAERKRGSFCVLSEVQFFPENDGPRAEGP